ncbi:MAG: peptide-methionine (S)-S-oxide reductase MsrA [Daejeonella sp.]|uniref:peptide-methionine (S)-S-oxide reductase MsrA n=1 Tax=Daejeonella sp. JGW-45 TaxID=3034148 RepID=UPI0023ECDEB6|nr:peptide-methionine (S)-S-oxide reductase MsrA [Daejeonella sp. JGW-45]
MEQATFGGGCFWCTEAVFQNLKGVTKVVSGYMGGHTDNPTYKDICTGETGHAEIIQIEYNESEIRFEDLLLIFFKTHDPTTLNRQGNDIGTQYRSVIFYENQEQKAAAENMIDKLEKEMVFDKPIVTEITPISKFYSAEDYHQNYFNINPNQSYCAAVIQPKLVKFTREFGDRLK